MLYHERECKNKENANFVYIVSLLTKLCNIFDVAFLLTSVYKLTEVNYSFGEVFKCKYIYNHVVTFCKCAFQWHVLETRILDSRYENIII